MKRLGLMATVVALLGVGTASAGTFETGVLAQDRGDYTAALKAFEPLATKGNARAQYFLGAMYARGWGVIQDYAEAVNWYRQAAAQGDAEAQRDLGVMYRDGLGVSGDLVHAHMWFNLGAAGGAANAARSRDEVAKRLKPEQVRQAQKLAEDCKRGNFKGCQ